MFIYKITHVHSGAVTRGRGWDPAQALINRHPRLAGRISKVRDLSFTTPKAELFTLSLAFAGRKPGTVRVSPSI